jgi:hypothetical protein
VPKEAEVFIKEAKWEMNSETKLWLSCEDNARSEGLQTSGRSAKPMSFERTLIIQQFTKQH